MRILLFLLLLIPTCRSLGADNQPAHLNDQQETTRLLIDQPLTNPRRFLPPATDNHNTIQDDHHHPQLNDHPSREQQVCWIMKGFLGYICLSFAVGTIIMVVFSKNHELTI